MAAADSSSTSLTLRASKRDRLSGWPTITALAAFAGIALAAGRAALPWSAVAVAAAVVGRLSHVVLTAGPVLRLDETGFSNGRIDEHWADIAGAFEADDFEVPNPGAPHGSFVRFEVRESPDRTARQVALDLSGTARTIENVYGFPSDELADLLNGWLLRYRSATHRKPGL